MNYSPNDTWFLIPLLIFNTYISSNNDILADCMHSKYVTFFICQAFLKFVMKLCNADSLDAFREVGTVISSYLSADIYTDIDRSAIRWYLTKQGPSQFIGLTLMCTAHAQCHPQTTHTYTHSIIVLFRTIHHEIYNL